MNRILSILFYLLAAQVVCNGAEYKPDPVLNNNEKKQISAAVPENAARKPLEKRKVLVFSRTCGFRHYNGIFGAKYAIEKCGIYQNLRTVFFRRYFGI